MCASAGGEKDYVNWLAHSMVGGASETDGCVLGYKETYRRLRRLSVCRNGRDYVVIRKQTPCPCSMEDYMWCVGRLPRVLLNNNNNNNDGNDDDYGKKKKNNNNNK